jgi:hypothetical protein
MAPKRRRDAVAKEIPNMYIFGRSLIDEGMWICQTMKIKLTPNAILRLLVYMWICQTMKIKPSTKGFASAHQVHHQRRIVFEEEGDNSVEKDCQFGCLNFSYKSGVVSPVTAYRNKWP